VAFLLAAASLVYYPVRAGSYDIVPRQEEAVVIWIAVALGYGLGIFPRARGPRGRYVALVAIGALAAWVALSLSWTESDERTFAELARVLHYGGLLVLVWGALDRGTWTAAAAGLAFAAMLVSGLAVTSRLAPGAFPVNWTGRALHTDRLSYPFNYWNAVGAWGAMSVAMALAWSAHARSLGARAAFAAVLPLCGLAVYLSYSRAGVTGVALGVAAVIVLGRNRWLTAVQAGFAAGATALAIEVVRHQPAIAHGTGTAGAGTTVLALAGAAVIAIAGTCLTWAVHADHWRLRPPIARRAAMVGVVVVVLTVAIPARPALSHAWNEFRNQPAAPSADPAARLTNLNGNRYFIYRSAFREFKHEPLHGTGPGTFEFWWSRHGGAEFVRDAHSLYLESLGEMGLIGFLLVVAFLLGLVLLFVQGRGRLASPGEFAAHIALASAFVVFLFQAGVDWMWESTAVAVLALVSAAVAAGPGFESRAQSAAVSAEAHSRAVARRAAVVVAAVIAALVQLPGLVSVSSMRRSQALAQGGSSKAALAKANDAIQAEPWAASPYVQRGLLEEAAGDLRAARTDLLRARRREPTNWRHPLVLARIDAEQGHVPAALANARAARRLRPRSAFFSAR
jgi:SAM-dependent methyltransferase